MALNLAPFCHWILHAVKLSFEQDRNTATLSPCLEIIHFWERVIENQQRIKKLSATVLELEVRFTEQGIWDQFTDSTLES